jgi:hypothetical protein
MRHYPTNSPEAMARIVACALLADGAIDLSEFEALEQQKIVGRIGLDQATFDRVVHEFCEDLMTYASRTSSGRLDLDPESIELLLGDIENPALRARTLWMMVGLVTADGSVTGDEAQLLTQATRTWANDAAPAH